MIKVKEYVRKMQNINVLVNSFVEALGVVFILSEFDLNKSRNNEFYIEEVKKYFSKFKNSEIVDDFRNLLNINSFKYDAPIELILNITNNILPSSYLMQRGNFNLTKFEKIKQHFLNFYNESNFDKFFKAKKSYFINNIDIFIKSINEYNPHKYLFNLIGIGNDNLNICLMHGITTANYGLNVNNKLYCCVRPYKLSRFVDVDFAYNKPYITSLILHEFAHSFINPLTDKFIKEDKINKDKLEEIMRNNSYGEHYVTAINETIIRAIECMYINKFFNNEYLEFKKEYLNEGFTLIDEVVETLNRFVKKRKIGESIEIIYNELLNIFYK